MTQSTAFDQLSPIVQRWVYQQGWNTLRPIQEMSIAPVMSMKHDVLIGASTASGKTEAAFLPALSCAHDDGVSILYISPLKALINDQYRRLEILCDMMQLPLTPWHGDVTQSVKNKQKRKPGGVILITPESLESILIRDMGFAQRAFSNLNHIIIDEFHAFLGTERGIQLQSLMRRLEYITGKRVSRIALSATLGNAQMAAAALREHTTEPPVIIQTDSQGSDLKLQLRGYKEPLDDKAPKAIDLISHDLYKLLRNKSNLIFANSRNRTELLTSKLAELSEQNVVPNEFFAHHGNLAKELRQSVEKRLQEEKFPTTAVATATLELGIDIGRLDSIAQVSTPHSVASLRQRLGRAGRRGEPAILRLFIQEDEIGPDTNVADLLRLSTVQTVAMINLLLRGWYEPPDKTQYHFSTLIQQTLAVTAQYGGVNAARLYSLLVKTGPFSLVSVDMYKQLLQELGHKDFLTQSEAGEITLGVQGEHLVGHYSFFTAFQTPEEYRLEFSGRTIGSMPITRPLAADQQIIFAGQRWQVLNINAEAKIIMLDRALGGQAPQFDGSGMQLAGEIRREMQRIYTEKEIPIYLDQNASQALQEGIKYFHEYGLDQATVIEEGEYLYMMPWISDKAMHARMFLLRRSGLSANHFGAVIDIKGCNRGDLDKIVHEILAHEKPTVQELAAMVEDTIIEKYDNLLPEHLQRLGYGHAHFDIDSAWDYLTELVFR